MSGRGPTVEQRLAALEKYVRELPLADTIAPAGGQTIAPDGSVAYDFDGHVRAAGLDLLAGTNSSPPDDRKIRWLRESDGVRVAELLSFDTGTEDALELAGRGVSGSRGSAFLKASDNSGGVVASLHVQSKAGAGWIAGATADAGGFSRVILDTLGQSGFLELTQLSSMRLHPVLFFPGYVGLPAGGQASVDVTHNLGLSSGNYICIGAPFSPGQGAASWGWEHIDGNTVRIWTKNNDSVARTYNIGFALLTN